MCLNDLCLILCDYSESLSAVTLLLHADWMIVRNASNQGGANSMTAWQAKSQPRMLVAPKAAFLKNYLAVSTWIFNGSLTECHETKHQLFSLFGVWFGSWAIQIFGWKSAWCWSSRKWAKSFHLWLLLITCTNSQRKTHQIAQIRHFKPQKFCNKRTV